MGDEIPNIRLPNLILRNSNRATLRRLSRRRRSAPTNRNRRLIHAIQSTGSNAKVPKLMNYGPYTSQTKIQSSESKHTQAGKTKKKAKRKNKKRTKGRNKRRKNSYKRKRKK